jgi:molybdate transport system ATP-binding protein
VFRPSDVRIVPGAFRGSATSRTTTWSAAVVRFEQTVGGVRVHTATGDGRVEVAVDVAMDELADAGLRPGAAVVLQAPAAAVRLLPV